MAYSKRAILLFPERQFLSFPTQLVIRRNLYTSIRLVSVCLFPSHLLVKKKNHLLGHFYIIIPWQVALIPDHWPSAPHIRTLLPIRAYPVSQRIPHAAFSTGLHRPPTTNPFSGNDNRGQVTYNGQYNFLSKRKTFGYFGH